MEIVSYFRRLTAGITGRLQSESATSALAVEAAVDEAVDAVLARGAARLAERVRGHLARLESPGELIVLDEPGSPYDPDVAAMGRRELVERVAERSGESRATLWRLSNERLREMAQ